MVTELLHRSGFSLGDPNDLLPPSPDNRAGYWENGRIVEINKALLRQFSGTWNSPPVFPDRWWESPELEGKRAEARQLLTSSTSAGEHFAYKDPRTCLTLPFWQMIAPDQKHVVVIRHPDEVAQSLTVRRMEVVSRARALDLYVAYYRGLIPLIKGSKVVVSHNVSYFYDAPAELSRVLEAVGAQHMIPMVPQAVSHVRSDLRHGFTIENQKDYFEVPAEASDLYDEMCQFAGPVWKAANSDGEFCRRSSEITIEKALVRLAKLEQLYVQKFEEEAALRREYNEYRAGVSTPMRYTMAVLRRLGRINRSPLD
jgi:hypothetical protein